MRARRTRVKVNGVYPENDSEDAEDYFFSIWLEDFAMHVSEHLFSMQLYSRPSEVSLSF